MNDLTQLADEALDALYRDCLTEQGRRACVASAPARIEQAASDAVRAGADPQTIRAAVEDGLTPKE